MNHLLFQDKNFDEFAISKNGKDISIKIIDMYKGEHFSDINCLEVSYFELVNNTFEEGFPCYVGEARVVRKSGKLELLIIGGEIQLKLECTNIQIDGVALSLKDQ